ncbi:CDP-diacylglycerol---serine O-phosphatidyltransferase [Lishizhenia tianjinensis]|uniref:CDP-diacylglycerol---serine O-phosphatidyltransferase n=1 Tax=Lishizhenia tianjinensis TaxID=477690 RepID=A0A1I7BN55_9FLAO|nr:CDP-alcohol phosphatidyltransferase family protein [Lishizhenia tianjinensis]SFT88586.1 CDP-diacylglycerol---serine O-phosphatidyltransferase [Lishizhenia tianjinensis]
MFTLPNITTGLNLLSGCASIIFALGGRLELAVLFIFLAAIFDFLDGMLARALKLSGELGKQLDSLADMVSFGFAPGIIVFVLFILGGAMDIFVQQGGSMQNFWMNGTFGYNISYWIQSYFNDLLGNQSALYPPHFKGWYLFLPFVGFIIPFFSLFRLAKFNLDTRQTTSFIGLPTPANTIFFASFALMLWDGFGTDDWRATLSTVLIQDQVLMTLTVVFSVLLVSELPLFSLKFKSLKFKENGLRYIFLLISLILIALLLVWALPIIILLYLILSIIDNYLIKNRKHEIQS